MTQAPFVCAHRDLFHFPSIPFRTQSEDFFFAVFLCPSSGARAEFRNYCEVVRFEKGGKATGDLPAAEYKLDKTNADNLFQIATADGKVITGQFHFQIKDSAGAVLVIEDGRFKAEDRQR